MNTLPAQEIKRRGVKAIELALKNGPVHIIKNNIPACVVLSEAQYAQITKPHPIKQTRNNSLLQWIINKNPSGNKNRDELDSLLSTERDGWDR
jgi:hypothetical protein